jgi:hypothetical protein
MAEQIARPAEPHPTPSRLLYEHMREHGVPVVLIENEPQEDE